MLSFLFLSFSKPANEAATAARERFVAERRKAQEVKHPKRSRKMEKEKKKSPYYYLAVNVAAAICILGNVFVGRHSS